MPFQPIAIIIHLSFNSFSRMRANPEMIGLISLITTRKETNYICFNFWVCLSDRIPDV